MDMEAAEKLVQAARWYHSFEVLPGLWTPGVHRTESRELLNSRFGLAEDLTGINALDIGALDGPHSFELERRGAQVTSVDIQCPDVTGYSTAVKIRGSKNEYFQGSVYGLNEFLNGRTFDVVLFFGVWYHLKHPVLAFEQIASVLSPIGVVYFEGEALKNYAALPDGSTYPDSQFVAQLAESDIPMTLYYSGPYKQDQWSWFVPNRACVNEWLETASLRMVSHGFWDSHPHQRMFGSAVRRPGATIHVDNPVWTRE
ncbi:MAG: class I SAM-dependent methyltransferase [Planctomycetia bacterium]|nr:class I SAM-dependent methyltransferase [Planctomycetia bacterium]